MRHSIQSHNNVLCLSGALVTAAAGAASRRAWIQKLFLLLWTIKRRYLSVVRFTQQHRQLVSHLSPSRLWRLLLFSLLYTYIHLCVCSTEMIWSGCLSLSTNINHMLRRLWHAWWWYRVRLYFCTLILSDLNNIRLLVVPVLGFVLVSSSWTLDSKSMWCVSLIHNLCAHSNLSIFK